MQIIVLLTIIGLGCVPISQAHPTGAPESQCKDMGPNHQVKPQTSRPPYQIILSKTTVQGGEPVRVRLAGVNIPFKGFLSRASKQVEAGSEEPVIGKIISVNNDATVKNLNCFGYPNSAVTHTNRTPKQSVEFDWIPPNDEGTYVILTTFVKDYKTFWVGVSSVEVEVKRNPKFFPDDEEQGKEMDQDPDAFSAVIKKLRENFIGGCGQAKGCFALPHKCLENKVFDCNMFTSWQLLPNKQFKFQVAGRLPGWQTYEDTQHISQGHVSSGISHDNMMGSDIVTGCVYQNGEVRPKSYYNLPNAKQNSAFQNETVLLGYERTGEYMSGYVMCEFTRPPYFDDETKEVGRNYDLVKTPVHVLMARAVEMSVNAQNKREKLGYHTDTLDKGISGTPIDLTTGYVIEEHTTTTTLKPTTTTISSNKNDTKGSTGQKLTAYSVSFSVFIFCLIKKLVYV